jgi:transketolase
MAKAATREAYGAFLEAYGDENKEIVVLDADLSKSTMTNGFAKKYPDRFFDMGIAEQNLMGVAAGMAAAGKTAVASTFAVFAAGRAFEIIRNSVCYPKLNVKICATHAGLTVGEDGASHQAIEDIAIMRALPNMTVVNPADAVSAHKLLREAMVLDGPAYVRLGRAKVNDIYSNEHHIALGKAMVLKPGQDVSILATGIMVEMALAAREQLLERGIEAQVLDIHTIKPLDVEAVLNAARATGALVTAEEHSIIGGLGGAVAEVVAEHYPVPLKRVGLKDVFGESGKPEQLLAKYELTPEAIVQAALGAMSLKNR